MIGAARRAAVGLVALMLVLLVGMQRSLDDSSLPLDDGEQGLGGAPASRRQAHRTEDALRPLPSLASTPLLLFRGRSVATHAGSVVMRFAAEVGDVPDRLFIEQRRRRSSDDSRASITGASRSASSTASGAIAHDGEDDAGNAAATVAALRVVWQQHLCAAAASLEDLFTIQTEEEEQEEEGRSNQNVSSSAATSSSSRRPSVQRQRLRSPASVSASDSRSASAAVHAAFFDIRIAAGAWGLRQSAAVAKHRLQRRQHLLQLDKALSLAKLKLAAAAAAAIAIASKRPAASSTSSPATATSSTPPQSSMRATTTSSSSSSSSSMRQRRRKDHETVAVSSDGTAFRLALYPIVPHAPLPALASLPSTIHSSVGKRRKFWLTGPRFAVRQVLRLLLPSPGALGDAAGGGGNGDGSEDWMVFSDPRALSNFSVLRETEEAGNQQQQQERDSPGGLAQGNGEVMAVIITADRDTVDAADGGDQTTALCSIALASASITDDSTTTPPVPPLHKKKKKTASVSSPSEGTKKASMGIAAARGPHTLPYLRDPLNTRVLSARACFGLRPYPPLREQRTHNTTNTSNITTVRFVYDDDDDDDTIDDSGYTYDDGTTHERERGRDANTSNRTLKRMAAAAASKRRRAPNKKKSKEQNLLLLGPAPKKRLLLFLGHSHTRYLVDMLGMLLRTNSPTWFRPVGHGGGRRPAATGAAVGPLDVFRVSHLLEEFDVEAAIRSTAQAIALVRASIRNVTDTAAAAANASVSLPPTTKGLSKRAQKRRQLSLFAAQGLILPERVYDLSDPFLMSVNAPYADRALLESLLLDMLPAEDDMLRRHAAILQHLKAKAEDRKKEDGTMGNEMQRQKEETAQLQHGMDATMPPLRDGDADDAAKTRRGGGRARAVTHLILARGMWDARYKAGHPLDLVHELEALLVASRRLVRRETRVILLLPHHAQTHPYPHQHYHHGPNNTNTHNNTAGNQHGVRQQQQDEAATSKKKHMSAATVLPAAVRARGDAADGDGVGGFPISRLMDRTFLRRFFRDSWHLLWHRRCLGPRPLSLLRLVTRCAVERATTRLHLLEQQADEEAEAMKRSRANVSRPHRACQRKRRKESHKEREEEEAPGNPHPHFRPPTAGLTAATGLRRPSAVYGRYEATSRAVDERRYRTQCRGKTKQPQQHIRAIPRTAAPPAGAQLLEHRRSSAASTRLPLQDGAAGSPPAGEGGEGQGGPDDVAAASSASAVTTPGHLPPDEGGSGSASASSAAGILPPAAPTDAPLPSSVSATSAGSWCDRYTQHISTRHAFYPTGAAAGVTPIAVGGSSDENGSTVETAPWCLDEEAEDGKEEEEEEEETTPSDSRENLNDARVKRKNQDKKKEVVGVEAEVDAAETDVEYANAAMPPLFDVFDTTDETVSAFAAQYADQQGHHYVDAALEGIVLKLLDAHICPLSPSSSSTAADDDDGAMKQKIRQDAIKRQRQRRKSTACAALLDSPYFTRVPARATGGGGGGRHQAGNDPSAGNDGDVLWRLTRSPDAAAAVFTAATAPPDDEGSSSSSSRDLAGALDAQIAPPDHRHAQTQIGRASATPSQSSSPSSLSFRLPDNVMWHVTPAVPTHWHYAVSSQHSTLATNGSTLLFREDEDNNANHYDRRRRSNSDDDNEADENDGDVFYTNVTYRFTVEVGCACHLPRYASLCELGGEKGMEMTVDEDRWILERVATPIPRRFFSSSAAQRHESANREAVSQRRQNANSAWMKDGGHRNSHQYRSAAALLSFLFPLEAIDVAVDTNRTVGGW